MGRDCQSHLQNLPAAARQAAARMPDEVPTGGGVAARPQELRADVATALTAGPAQTELLMLQGRPIGEPVVQHGLTLSGPGA